MPLDCPSQVLKRAASRAIAAASSAAAAIVLLGAPLAEALDVKPLAGTYAIGSATLVDPPPDEKKDRLLLYLDGKTAREVYDAMEAPARASACDPDLRTKSAGALECSRSKAGEYTCSLGVSLARGTAVKASVC